MKTYTKNELKEVLERHKLYLQYYTKGQRAYLSGANLSGAYLNGANLNGADLSGAYLNGADLSRANLSGADLNVADLSRANLSGADLNVAYLSRADLSRADLSRANLSGADLNVAYLSRADLNGANLSGAYLNGAYLNGANLSRANLSGADLNGADLSGADLNGANLSREKWQELEAKFKIVTQDTKYVYKKLQNGVIAHLEIPKNARRTNAFTRKCRAEYVKVLKLIDHNGNEINEAFSMYDNEFKYVKGKIVKPMSYEPKWYVECGAGIHFFLTEQEAKEFTL